MAATPKGAVRFMKALEIVESGVKGKVKAEDTLTGNIATVCDVDTTAVVIGEGIAGTFSDKDGLPV